METAARSAFTSLGRPADQAENGLANVKQWGHWYEKYSVTTIFDASDVGTTGLMRMKSLPSTGSAACGAAAASARSAMRTRRVAVFMCRSTGAGRIRFPKTQERSLAWRSNQLSR